MLAIYLPLAARPKKRTCGYSCVSNLKQVGLGFRMWSNDHAERFPWQTPISEGGTKELANLPYAAWHYLVVSNELHSPKILTCPHDAGRFRTNAWNSSLHLSLSYFAGLNGDETKPNTILAGDRNVSRNSSTMAGLLTVRDVRELQVTPGLHQTHVNVGLSDGSVAQLKRAELRKAAEAEMKMLSDRPVRLVIP
jgi:hypothetical protein